jgi:hypothetical protein
MTAISSASSEMLEPGEMAVQLKRVLPDGHVIEFESAPAGWPAQNGEPRTSDWRAYYLTDPAGVRARVASVTTICAAVLPKDGLAAWSERNGICGAIEAFRRGLISPETSDIDAVRTVRRYRLGADAARDHASERGLNLHALLAAFMASGRAPNPSDHPEPHRPFIRALVRWLLHADPEPIAVEFLVGDPEQRYAGRADLLARINGRLTLVDLKSQERGAIYEAAHLQARLYALAESRFGEYQIDDCRVVVVDGAGRFRDTPVLCDEELARRALAFWWPVRGLSAICDRENRRARETLPAGT